MSEAPTTRTTLELSTLPKFYRNKPYDDDLYSFNSGLPASDRESTHMLLLFGPWHDQYARRIDERIVKPGYGEPDLSDEEIVNLRVLSDQIKCVSALAKLIEQGPGTNTPLQSESIPPTVLTQFVNENPYFYIAAREAGQPKKDPRYVAKIEEIVPVGYTFGSGQVSVEVAVSDVEGNKGAFPANTDNWRLAHLATSHMIHLPFEFRYINNGYR